MSYEKHKNHPSVSSLLTDNVFYVQKWTPLCEVVLLDSCTEIVLLNLKDDTLCAVIYLLFLDR